MLPRNEAEPLIQADSSEVDIDCRGTLLAIDRGILADDVQQNPRKVMPMMRTMCHWSEDSVAKLADVRRLRHCANDWILDMLGSGATGQYTCTCTL